MTDIFLALLLVSCIVAAVFVSQKQKPHWKRNAGIAATMAVLFFIAFGVTSDREEATKTLEAPSQAQVAQVTTPEPTSAPEPTATPEPKKWEQLGTEHNNKVQNFFILVKTPERDKESLKNLAISARGELCDRDCNVFLYSTEEAYKLQLEYDKIFKPAEVNAWKAKNAKYMLENDLGHLTFGTDNFSESDWTRTANITPVPIDANGFPKDYEAVTIADLDKSPKSYEYKTIMFTCEVSSFAKDESGEATAVNCVDPNDFSARVQVSTSALDMTKINKDDKIRFYAMGAGAGSGENAFGATVQQSLAIAVYMNNLTNGYKE